MGRLCQGIRTGKDGNVKRVNGTNTFHVIHYNDTPQDRSKYITYTFVVCEVRPQKEEPNSTCITVGGNQIYYPGDTGTNITSLELINIIINSVLLRCGAKFACFDVKNVYLGTPLDRPQYANIRLSDIPQESVD